MLINLGDQLELMNNKIYLSIKSPFNIGINFFKYFMHMLFRCDYGRYLKLVCFILFSSIIFSLIQASKFKEPRFNTIIPSVIGALIFSLIYLIYLIIYRRRTWQQSIKIVENGIELPNNNIHIASSAIKSFRISEMIVCIELSGISPVIIGAAGLDVYCESLQQRNGLESILNQFVANKNSI